MCSPQHVNSGGPTSGRASVVQTEILHILTKSATNFQTFYIIKFNDFLVNFPGNSIYFQKKPHNIKLFLTCCMAVSWGNGMSLKSESSSSLLEASGCPL